MMENYTIHIKNMVCNRCIMMVTEALKKAGFTPLSVELGTAFKFDTGYCCNSPYR